MFKYEEWECPACGSSNLSTEHLLYEYREMRKASFDRMFGHNARNAQRACARLLIARGVTHEPNIFGDISLRAD